jgi:hypothetical protein
MNKLLLGMVGSALLLAGCGGQSGTSSASMPTQALQSLAHPDLTCAPGKNSCLYFKPSVVTNPGVGNSVTTTAYTSPAKDTNPPTYKHGVNCRGTGWVYTASVDPNYVVGPDGNSLQWTVTVTLTQHGKNPGQPAPGSLCTMLFGSDVGHGNLNVSTPNS